MNRLIAGKQNNENTHMRNNIVLILAPEEEGSLGC
jgi:hypothetical protein